MTTTNRRSFLKPTIAGVGAFAASTLLYSAGNSLKKPGLLLIVFLLSFSSLVFGDVRLPSIISDNMVLQQDCDVSIWGWADPGEKVDVTPGWGAKAVGTVADDKGKWLIKIRTPKASGPHTLVVKGKNTIEVKNVLVGEVWLCSGQSNMTWQMYFFGKYVSGGEEDIKNSTNDKIRYFNVGGKVTDEIMEDVRGQWVECNPETSPKFSAASYYFGRKVQGETGYPVGLIHASVGGTSAQGWTRSDFIRNDDGLSHIIDNYDKMVKEWEQACIEAEKQKKREPRPKAPGRKVDEAGILYNGWIRPIIDMTIKGVIWYQGESNARHAYTYRELFPTLIKNWRCDFRNFDMPFYFVQLANFTEGGKPDEVKPYRGEPREHEWAELREAQFMANRTKNTGMAVNIDIGDSHGIHPSNKRDCGERLALWALAKDYGKDVIYSGPLYAGYAIEEGQIRVYFNHAESGLKFRDGAAKGFAIAGKDRKFVWANARIEGDTVVVWSDKVKEPVAVRYGWDTDPEVSLYNKADLPASPFRTDDWNGITFGVDLHLE